MKASTEVVMCHVHWKYLVISTEHELWRAGAGRYENDRDAEQGVCFCETVCPLMLLILPAYLDSSVTPMSLPAPHQTGV